MRPTLPEIECEQHHPSIPTPDLPAAVAFYTDRLGFRLAFTFGEPPSMAGVNLGNAQVFLEQGPASPAGISLFFVVSNADELLAYQVGQGVEVVEPIGDRHYGIRDYRIRDLNGYVLGFGHRLSSGGPPIDVERVDVPVRLEKRLAALLQDLAARKRMSVSSCLEETLLHTLDGVGPHTKGDLSFIHRLKAKHGIDYDTHGSYRFREVPPLNG